MLVKSVDPLRDVDRLFVEDRIIEDLLEVERSRQGLLARDDAQGIAMEPE